MAGDDVVERDYRDRVKRVFKGELKRRGIGYDELAARLGELGIEDSPANIANKISRGSFTAVFLFQCMDAIGCTDLNLRDPASAILK
jgi:hypothetical protein